MLTCDLIHFREITVNEVKKKEEKVKFNILPCEYATRDVYCLRAVT